MTKKFDRGVENRSNKLLSTANTCFSGFNEQLTTAL